MNSEQVLDISNRWIERLAADGRLDTTDRMSLISELDAYIASGLKAEHFRRLSLLCAQKVYFRWRDRYPMVDLTMFYHQLLRDRDVDRAIRELAGLHHHLKTMLSQDRREEGTVAYAAAMAIYAAARDAVLGPAASGMAEEDENDLPEEMRDTSYFAATAYVGVVPAKSETEVLRRRQFWVWYLTEAVPAAYSDSTRR